MIDRAEDSTPPALAGLICALIATVIRDAPPWFILSPADVVQAEAFRLVDERSGWIDYTVADDVQARIHAPVEIGKRFDIQAKIRRFVDRLDERQRQHAAKEEMVSVFARRPDRRIVEPLLQR